MLDKKKLEEFKTQAKSVLDSNYSEVTLNNITYKRDVPSTQFYVHQWNWDSATHALGLLYIDEERAYDELRALVSGQWKNGLIAQITFNPAEKKYFPGPQFWGTEAQATGEIVTSGITQPPILAISVHHLFTHAKNKEKAKSFAEEMYPALVKYHEYLKTYRDRDNSGLITVVHPWEGGTDNSPRYDYCMEQIAIDSIPDEVKILVNHNRSDDKLGDTTHRPGLDDYYRYMYLVHLYKNWNWDYNTIIEKSPFAIKDILFSILWCRANESLAGIAKGLGKPEDAKRFAAWADQTRKAIIGTWDEEKQVFTDIDVSRGAHTHIYENTISNVIALWIGIDDEKLRTKLVNKIKDPKQFFTKYPLPSTAYNSPKFDTARYWRGPVWPITNMFVIEALSQYSDPDMVKLRDEILEKTISLFINTGLYEYFDPTKDIATEDGKGIKGLGFSSFSWPAAIYLYLYNNYLKK